MIPKALTLSTIMMCITMSGCSDVYAKDKQQVPASIFDLTHWYLTVPLDENRNGVSDIYDVDKLQSFSHPDYFYLDANNHLVFASPNRAATERTSTNTRSELRYMIRGNDYSIAESSPQNNFALAAHKFADQYASIGGKLTATLHVDHVARNATYPDKPPAFSVVIGQVHAYQVPNEQQIPGFGWGNEPLKIYYKKWPNHAKGSVFWTYERNLATEDPKRIDIAYPVWGNNWDDKSDPADSGIALGEEFSYTVNIYQNIMYLTFSSPTHETIHHQINLANNINANGEIDHADYVNGYKDESLYFKAGAYNQCSTKANSTSFRYPACAGTGNWSTDLANGDYTQVTFSKLSVTSATAM